MKHYGLDIAEGTDINNLTVPSGTTFPLLDNAAELFFKTDENKLYVRNNTIWVELSASAGGTNADTLNNEAGSFYLDGSNFTGTIDGGTF